MDAVSEADSALLKEVQHWQDLPVIRHQTIPDLVSGHDQSLKNFQGNCDDLWVTGVQGLFNGNNQLWDDWQNLAATSCKHVKDTLDRKEAIGVVLLPDSIEKDRQEVVVVKLFDLDFPLNFIELAVLHLDWQITAVIEDPEVGSVDRSGHKCSSQR